MEHIVDKGRYPCKGNHTPEDYVRFSVFIVAELQSLYIQYKLPLIIQYTAKEAQLRLFETTYNSSITLYPLHIKILYRIYFSGTGKCRKFYILSRSHDVIILRREALARVGIKRLKSNKSNKVTVRNDYDCCLIRQITRDTNFAIREEHKKSKKK